MLELYKLYEHFNESTIVVLSLSMILAAGFIVTRFTKALHMPNVSGFILAGVLISPSVLGLINPEVITHMSFVSDLALAYIAFGVGQYFTKEIIMKTGLKTLIVTAAEALTAGILVTFVTLVFFDIPSDFALLLGAIATATAPASTLMTIKQYNAKGDFINLLLQVVALDDIVCLLAFSLISALCTAHLDGSVNIHSIIRPIGYNILLIVIGVIAALVLTILLKSRSKDNRLILVNAFLLLICGVAGILDVSPLLACMVFAMVYVNLTHDDYIFHQLDNFTPPIMSTFFIYSGINMKISALASVGIIGVVYFVVRIIGKYLGSYISCKWMGYSKTITSNLGLALIPQAGVAIGLAFLGQRILPEALGDMLVSVILASSVLYELVGPISAKYALRKSGSIATMK